MQKITLVLMGMVLLVSGCKKEQTVSYNRGEVVAQVNDAAITKTYFDKKFEAIKSLLKETQGENAEMDTAAIKKGLLDQLVRTEMLAQEAKKRGMDKERDFQETMQAIERDLLAQAMYAKLLRDVTVTSEEVERFYTERKDQLKSPLEIKVREIVTKTKGEAEQILSRALQGEKFSTLAEQYSIADSAKKGGQLDSFKTDDPELDKRKFPKFLNMVFSLEKGDVSSPIQGPDNNYYLVKVEDRKGGEVKKLSELEEQIKRYLQTEKENKIINDAVRQIEKTAKIVKNEELIK